MSAPMTRGRLALIRDGYKPALDSYDSEDFVEVCVADLRELVSACESLLNERDGIRDAALEEAAKVAEDYDGDGIHNGDYYAQLGDARQTVRDITDAIRALKGKR